MKLIADLHCHTLASGHAYSTIEEIVRAAAGAGLEAVAITDHGPKLQETPKWYFTNFRVIPDQAMGVEIFRGVEANILDGSGAIDADAEMMKNLNLVLASCHNITIFGPDSDYFTAASIGAMKNPRVNILAHPDDGRVPVRYPEIVRAAAQTNTLLEVNNHSLSPKAPRPGAPNNVREMLKLCRKQGVPVVVSSDAHISFAVGQFEYAIRMLEEENFPEELIANTSLDRLKSLLQLKRSV